METPLENNLRRLPTDPPTKPTNQPTENKSFKWLKLLLELLGMYLVYLVVRHEEVVEINSVMKKSSQVNAATVAAPRNNQVTKQSAMQLAKLS